MCSFALFLNYFLDRFSLMRTWKRQGHLGPNISKFSRRYFFSLALVAMAILSSYYWSGFPFDNICENDTAVASRYVGSWSVQPPEGNAVQVNVAATDPSFHYCLQDFYSFPRDENSFPFISKWQPEGAEWMTDEQETVTDVYGWSSVGVLVVVLLSFLWGWYGGLKGLFHGTYSPRGQDQEINFSDVPSISAYVPQIESPVFAYPLVACSIEGLDEDLFDWTDPDRPFCFYDLTKDAEVLLRGQDVSSKVVFSQIRHWPPDTKAQ
jgi:hypothetical protein